MKSNYNIAVTIRIKGLVQGVGFRPFIYRLANRYGLKGWVENRNDGVVIAAEGSRKRIDEFIEAISAEAPPAASVNKVNFEEGKFEGYADFTIVKSKTISEEITDISPDIAVCDECLADLKKQPHRLNFPFINCTNCGPRFSIIRDLPYDRHKTTMDPFTMCETCRREYENVLDRRFHAQPVACSHCGPQYELITKRNILREFHDILSESAELLRNGEIIAIKGIGGFQIACDASNEQAVNRLRERKIREGKPFAVMFADLEAIKEYAYLYPKEERLIQSWRKPILILREKKRLAMGVSVGFRTIGAMLPYMPFHYLLFEKLRLPAIVLTSGNLSEEPIVIDNENAVDILTRIADAVLVYNREIYNRTDDSVVLVVNEKERVIRRSRGYSPEPVNLNLNVDDIFAAGAELMNCFCLGKGNQAILSQHIGDLKNLETFEFYAEALDRFKKMFRVNPCLVVYDKHPDYLSTKFAQSLGLEEMELQHHHAHIASCMAEHNLDEDVIGVALDGTGFGDDGNIWGGEFFTGNFDSFIRYTHFNYIALPGGDAVTKEPWRTGLSVLHKVYGSDLWNIDIPFIKQLDRAKSELILQAVKQNINCPLSSGAGRLFDAVAAITGICLESKFHAEAPMRLENIAAGTIDTAYPCDFGEVVSFEETIRCIVDDIQGGVSVTEISAKFHNTVINVIFAVVSQIRKETALNKVVLSGGTFQNKYLLSRIEKILEREKFEVYTHSRIPSNDGGIALGQLAIAAKRRESGKIK